MKKALYLVSAVLVALLLVVGLTAGISQVQARDHAGQDSPGNGSAPAAEPQGQTVQQQDSLVDWTSSAPLPAGSSASSPPDDTSTDDGARTDADIQATYDSYLRVSGAALKPRESDVEWHGAGGGGCVYASSGDTFAVFNTPVYLPQGSVIKYLRLYYNDTNETTNSSAWFTVYDLYGQIVLERSASSSGSIGTSYATTEEFTTTVDYSSYSYMINWRPNELGSDMQACGFRIYYQAPMGITSYMPVILTDSE